MDSLHEFARPQWLAGILAITLLALATGIEALIVALSLRPSARMGAGDPLAAEGLGHDFYDWLYE
ncbi:MAG: hypothetical protein ACKO0M_19125 [Cyanobium sp.]